MRSAFRKLLVPVIGIVAALALALPVSAQASTSAKAIPSLSAGNCFANFYLLDVHYFTYGFSSDTTGSNYGFGSGPADELCQAWAPNGTSVVIYDESGPAGDCLAYNSTTNDVYLHNSSGCDTGTASYLEWKFVYEQPAGDGNKDYELQNLDDPGKCVEGNSTANFGSCSPTGISLLEYVSPY